MEKRKTAVLISGGLDSCILLKEMSKIFDEVYPLYMRCGLIWERAELYWLKKFLKKANIKNVWPLSIFDVSAKDLYQSHWSLTGKGTPNFYSLDEEVYLPGRNLLILSKASVYCALHQIPNIALGILKANPFLDSTRDFFSVFEKSIQSGLGFRLKILTPFKKLKKTAVMAKADNLPLALTFSCLKPRGLKPCGSCNKCAEREKALHLKKSF